MMMMEIRTLVFVQALLWLVSVDAFIDDPPTVNCSTLGGHLTINVVLKGTFTSSNAFDVVNISSQEAWGDGFVSSGWSTFLPGNFELVRSHNYSSPGTYQVETIYSSDFQGTLTQESFNVSYFFHAQDGTCGEVGPPSASPSLQPSSAPTLSAVPSVSSRPSDTPTTTAMPTSTSRPSNAPSISEMPSSSPVITSGCAMWNHVDFVVVEAPLRIFGLAVVALATWMMVLL